MDHHPIHLHGYHVVVTATDGGDIPESAQRPETTVLTPVGSTRTIEFVADNPGDWAFHCHMSHHVMNQMGHKISNLIGAQTQGYDEKVRALLPGYMTMGQNGMAEMGEMQMPVPENSIPMVGAPGQYDYITMGGMFTILKVRETISDYDEDPGWYDDPPGTLALPAAAEVMRQNDIAEDGSSAPRAPGAAMRAWEQAKPAGGDVGGGRAPGEHGHGGGHTPEGHR
jgi:hypothetical protein